MARGDRSAKRLAQRIDVGYLKRPHPLRTWRFWLAVAAPLAALLWAVVLSLAGRQQVHSGGEMSRAHAIFGEQCQLCHDSTLGFFRRHASDQKCLACHDGPVHQANAAASVTCGSCHVEHRGIVQLANVSDSSCTECHAQLQVRSGTPRFASVITGFNRQHPEFAVLRARSADPGTLRFNHQTHMKAGLKAPGGGVQLVCTDCHRQETGGRWPYGNERARSGIAPTALARAIAENTPPSRAASRAMLAPKYAETCALCHALRFDARIAEEVPHEPPTVVREFVERKFRELLAAQPDIWREAPSSNRRLPDAQPASPAASPEQWLAHQIRTAETLLWRKTCAECHSLTMQENGLPRVAPANMTPVWMPHARFDHTAHRLLDCHSCHVVSASKETADVLLPGIANCQQCHREGQAAENRCFQCHTYHDWSQKKSTPAGFSIEEILGRSKAR